MERVTITLMSATITLAKQESTGRVLHINDVLKEQRTGFYCVGCGKEMIVVKSEARKKEWHFRHSEETLCTGSRDTALHNFAVQLLMDNSGITISKKLQIAYSDQRKEITVFGKRSDVAVKYENEDVHFEVFVTHDLDKEKIDIYKNNKIKCVRIDLSEPELLTAPPEKIKEAVLNQYKNKTVIYWQDEIVKPYESNESDFSWKHVLIVVGAFIGLRFLYNHFFKPKRRKL
jgi:predicted RNA-binding Zn-ribbon protein involved in translation (DUF1610 family)